MMIRIRKAEWKVIDAIDQTQVDVYVLGEWEHGYFVL